ncbi:MAG: fatty-acyl-CoA synthase [Acidimicrobiaceae bacterium]|nr:fatty-acyl-CoA synthase [Acidimicrobiaceae bacterium]MDQ1399288.1 fatty-acyl-CoA synthase [Acidimicrobiaceae bacterium]
MSTAAPATLPERIAAAAERSGGITFVGADPASATQVPWSQLHTDARSMAAALQARGVRPGDHVALLGPTSRGLVTAIQATWLAGATVVVLPLPMRLGSFDEFVSQTRARVASSDSSIVVMDPDLASFVEPVAGDPPRVLLSQLVGKGDDLIMAPPDPDRLAVVQFTSGSTSDPKGVMLTDRHILANLDGAMAAAHFDPDSDVIVSWLPLYHDMGLLGLLTIPMITGIRMALAGPQDFMSAPARWVEWMSHYGGTATAGPNFSYALSARALRRLTGLDLSPWRIALNGAEPVDPATVEAFCAAGAAHGLHRGAAFPAFGMAEVTIAGTFPEPGSGLRTDVVDRRLLESDRYAAPSLEGPGTRALALLGRPVGDLELRICDPQSGGHMAEREVGELQIRGTSVTSGYYKHPEATAEAFDGEWLKTGDLAYLVDGELVVCGRLKDVIIVGGRNVFPEDVERAAASVDGVRAGNVIAFGVEGRRGREAVIVVAETRAEDPHPIRQAVVARVLDAVGLPPEEVVLVPPGSLPKTSSGKLQRSLCRARYLEATLTSV